MKRRFHETLVALTLVLCSPLVAGAAQHVVTNCSGSYGVPGSLPEAIVNSNGGDTITFALSPPCSTITVVNSPSPAADLYLDRALTISGPGAGVLTIVGTGTGPVFGIAASVPATISRLTISNGVGLLDCCGGPSKGGGIYNLGTLSLDASVVSNNSADLGSGIYSTGNLTVTSSTVSNNASGSTFYESAAVLAVNDTTGANVSISESTIANNTSGPGTLGYGVYAHGNGGGSLTLSNSTVAGNTTGVGFYRVSQATIKNSTLASNGGGNLGDAVALSSFEIWSTILANNGVGAANCAQGVSNADRGYNLSDDASCGFFFAGSSGLNSTAAGLDPAGLKNNGGATRTIALASGSAALDHVTDALRCAPLDQRGIARTVPCDIGAFENTGGVVSGNVPIVHAVAPFHLLSSGGTAVTIQGSGFTGATGVKVGGAPATGVQVLGDDTIAAVAPAGSDGQTDLTVTGSGGIESAATPASRVFFATPLDQTVPCSNASCAIQFAPVGATSVAVSGTPACEVCGSQFTVQEQLGPWLPAGFKVNAKCKSGYEYDHDLVTFNPSGMTAFTTITLSAQYAQSDIFPPGASHHLCYQTGLPVPSFARAAAAGQAVGQRIALRRCGKTPRPPCILSIVDDPANGSVTVKFVQAGENASQFTFAPSPPELKKLKPTSGAVGSTLSIMGKNLLNVSSVVIGGVEAPIVSRKQGKLVVTVPAGAQTGPVTLTGFFGSILSTVDFTVF